MRWVSEHELAFSRREGRRCRTRRAPEMAEQEKGRGRLNRTLCGGRRAGEARSRGVQPPGACRGTVHRAGLRAASTHPASLSLVKGSRCLLPRHWRRQRPSRKTGSNSVDAGTLTEMTETVFSRKSNGPKDDSEWRVGPWGMGWVPLCRGHCVAIWQPGT